MLIIGVNNNLVMNIKKCNVESLGLKSNMFPFHYQYNNIDIGMDIFIKASLIFINDNFEILKYKPPRQDQLA